MTTAMHNAQTAPAEVNTRGAGITALLAACCHVVSFVAFFKFKSDLGMAVAYLGLLIPAVMSLGLGLADFKTASRTFLKTLVYLVPVVLSLAYNADVEKNIEHSGLVLLNLTYAIFLACIFSSRPECDLLPKIMRRVTLMIVPLLVYVILSQRGAYVWGRWEPYGIQPNWWGMMALGLAWCSLAWKNPLFRYGGIALALYYIYAVQSRGSLVAIVPLLLFSSGWFFPLTKRNLLRLVVCTMAGLFLSFTWLLYTDVDVLSKLASFLGDDVLRVSDRYRGISSGMSGRMGGYVKAWDSFTASPLFGGGYGNFGFVHNGFLMTLAESGIFAFMGLLYLFGKALRGAIRARRWTNIGCITSYLVLLLTFPRTLNTNLTGWLLLVIMTEEFGRAQTEAQGAKRIPSWKREATEDALAPQGIAPRPQGGA